MKCLHRICAEDRRNQVLEVACELFARQGFDGTTTRAIAARAGVNEAIIFRHFPSKEQLYRAVLEKKTQECGLAPQIVAILQRGDDVRERLVEITTLMLRSRTADPELTRLFLYSALEGHELSTGFMRSYMTQAIMKLAEFLRAAMKRGDVRKGNPQIMARAFFGMMTHYILLHDLFAGDRNLDHTPENVGRQVVDVWLDGILPDDSPMRVSAPPRRSHKAHEVH